MLTTEPNPVSGRPVVLVAEDNPSNYKLVEVILRNTCELLHAENGEQAVALYREHHPAVVLMDINMPVMDGYEALRRIREEFPEARAVALTAYAFETDHQRMQEEGFDYWLTKPLRTDELRQTVEELIARK